QALGATTRGRFTYIPESKGGGYITGITWGNDLRMMIRNYHLNEAVFIDWTNKLMEKQEHVHVSSVISMPSNTLFGSVAIGVSQQYLHQLFGHLEHPVVASVLAAAADFVLETGISAQIINAASEMLGQPVPEAMESHYYRLKCEELLCYTFALLMQREAVPLSKMHI
nr:hypothetical protein [Tanacetum cinerariifolium]